MTHSEMIDTTQGPSSAAVTGAFFGQGSGRRVGPDPGSRRAGWIAWALIAVFGLAVLVSQQIAALSRPSPVPRQGEGAVREVTPPTIDDPVSLQARVVLRIAELMPPQDREKATSQVGFFGEAGSVEAFRNQLLLYVLRGGEDRQKVVDEISSGVWKFEGAGADVDAVKALATDTSAGSRERMVARHGFIGEAASVAHLSMTDPARVRVLGGGIGLIVFFIGIGLFLLLAFIAAIVCFGLAIARMSRGGLRMTMDLPNPGGSVLLEIVAVFVGGFFLLKVLLEFVPALQGAQVGLQWLLLLAPLWALVRGVSWSQLRRLMGLHSGRGVLREIGAGIFAYFACLPLLIGAMVITAIIVIIWSLMQTAGPGGQAPMPVENPVLKMVGGGNALQLLMLYALASIWAPLAEELIFRGAFYRHLRANMGILIAGVFSAAVFAGMHGYPVFMLLPVMTLGFVFSLMREWRGSLIAPMVAHGMHNATVLGIVITLFSLLR